MTLTPPWRSDYPTHAYLACFTRALPCGPHGSMIRSSTWSQWRPDVGSSLTLIEVRRRAHSTFMFQPSSPALVWFTLSWLPVGEIPHLSSTGNHHFTPFHWLHPGTHSHFLPRPMACWHKSTSLTSFSTKGRLIKGGHSGAAVPVALVLHFIHPSIHPFIHTSSSPVLHSYQSICVMAAVVSHIRLVSSALSAWCRQARLLTGAREN